CAAITSTSGATSRSSVRPARETCSRCDRSTRRSPDGCRGSFSRMLRENAPSSTASTSTGTILIGRIWSSSTSTSTETRARVWEPRIRRAGPASSPSSSTSSAARPSPSRSPTRGRRRRAEEGAMPGDRASWSSEDSRDFLQERVALFARTNFFILGFFFLAGWPVAALWAPQTLSGGLPLTPAYLFELGSITVYLVMWLPPPGGAPPGRVLRTHAGGGR